jgi:nucleoside diphosphate kinase
VFAAEIIKKLEKAGYKIVIQSGQKLNLKLVDENKSKNKDKIRHLINELKNNKSAAVRFLKYRLG